MNAQAHQLFVINLNNNVSLATRHRSRGESGVLSGDEYQVLSELDVIEFLLGEDKVEVA